MTSFQNSVIKLGNSFFQLEGDNAYSNGDAVLSANISPENKVEMSISLVLQFLFNIELKLNEFFKKFKKTKELPDRKELEEMLHQCTRDRLLRILNEEENEFAEVKSEELTKNALNKESKVKPLSIENKGLTKMFEIFSKINTTYNKLIFNSLKLPKSNFNIKFILLKYG